MRPPENRGLIAEIFNIDPKPASSDNNPEPYWAGGTYVGGVAELALSAREIAKAGAARVVTAAAV